MQAILAIIAVTAEKTYRGVEFVFSKLMQYRFHRSGASIRFFPFSSVISYENISLGNNVFIGHHCTIQSSVANVLIGSHVMFGPYVTIMGGDHEISVIGKNMSDVKEKRAKSDLDVTINDDVWIGAGAIILKGVEIGQGAVVAAGSVVRNDVEPYSIVAGVPSRKVGDRFSDEDLIEHKKLLEVY